MPIYTFPQTLNSEGTLSFKLTPTENGRKELYLIDFGEEIDKNRITLKVLKTEEDNRMLSLEIFNDAGIFLIDSKDFNSKFKLGCQYDVAIEWSSEYNQIAVFIDNDKFLEINNSDVKLDNLGNKIHYGEDISGNNKSEMRIE